jgi:hypothetical protein
MKALYPSAVAKQRRPGEKVTKRHSLGVARSKNRRYAPVGPSTLVMKDAYIRVTLGHSAFVVCLGSWLTWLGAGDSPVITLLVLAVLGPM